MASLALGGEIREILVDVQERGAGNVALAIELATAIRVLELPAAIDELVARRLLPPWRQIRRLQAGSRCENR
jgi:hypothetical protein